MVAFVVVEAGNVDGALAMVRQNQLSKLTGVRAKKRSQYRMNGLDIVEEEGTAATPAGPTVWKLAVVTAARPVIVYPLSSPADLRAHQREYAQLQRSFRRL